MGDPIPSIPDRIRNPKRRRPQLLTVLVIVALVLSSFSAINTFGALRTVFPNTQVFSIGVSYSFANSQGSLLLPGSVGNITLTVNSALQKSTSIFLSFNTTLPGSFGYSAIGNCYPAVNRDLLVTINQGPLLPINTDLSAPANCVSTGNPGPPLPTTAQVTVNPGVNTYQAQISVDINSKIATTFSISWFASQ